MPSPTVDLLRNAVSSGAFMEAERLLGIYRSEMQSSWEAAGFAQRAAIAAEVDQVLEWARIATLAARSHAQRKLIHLSGRRAYAANVR